MTYFNVVKTEQLETDTESETQGFKTETETETQGYKTKTPGLKTETESLKLESRDISRPRLENYISVPGAHFLNSAQALWHN